MVGPVLAELPSKVNDPGDPSPANRSKRECASLSSDEHDAAAQEVSSASLALATVACVEQTEGNCWDELRKPSD